MGGGLDFRTRKMLENPISIASFDDWFSGSRVVNASGGPLPVYHGTPEDFSVFLDGEIFMSEDRTVAEDYGDRVLKLAACIKNSLTYEYSEGPPFSREEAIQKGFDGWQILNYDTGDEIFKAQGDVWVAFFSSQVRAFSR